MVEVSMYVQQETSIKLLYFSRNRRRNRDEMLSVSAKVWRAINSDKLSVRIYNNQLSQNCLKRSNIIL